MVENDLTFSKENLHSFTIETKLRTINNNVITDG